MAFEFNSFNLGPKAANYVEGFSEEIQDKYVVNQQCSVYLRGQERDNLETQCKTYKIPVNIKPRHMFPKKYPTANIDIPLTPGFYAATAIINNRKYQTFVYCNQNFQSECYILNIPTGNNIKNMYLNQLNYIGNFNEDFMKDAKLHLNNDYNSLNLFYDFVDSIKRTDELKSYINNKSGDPKIISYLAKMLNEQINQGLIDQRYLNEIKKYKNTEDYLYYIIYRIVLVNASVITDQLNPYDVKDKIEKGLIKQNLDELKRKLIQSEYPNLIQILLNTQYR